MLREPYEMTAADLSKAYRMNKLSPIETTQACLERIKTCDADINAFCLIDPAASLAQAEASEKRWRHGAPLSPLDGVPVAIKDLLLTKGWPTRRGSLTIDASGPCIEDAPAVARLREGGAVLIGKTTTCEFGWKGTTDSPLKGITRNPWDKTKTSGGSSGGSAAALAAHFAPLALGTDGGGSIRIPASFCGCYGFKPSFGRVPAYPLSPFGTLAHVGPMSRTVLDSALLLNVITRPDARDCYALAYEAIDYTTRLGESMKRKRIAFSPRLGYAKNVITEVESLVAAAAKRFEYMGAIVEVADPNFGDPLPIFRTLWWVAAGFILDNLSPMQKEQLDPGLRNIGSKGANIALNDYLRANLARGNYGSQMRQFMERYDFLLTPTVPIPAFAAGQNTPFNEDGDWMGWTPFSFPFNLTQQPAASINCGFTKAGLPVGLQIVGKMFDDAGVLAASAAYEAMDSIGSASLRNFKSSQN